MAALALNLPSFISAAQKGEDIDYQLMTQENINACRSGLAYRYLKGSKVISDQSAMPAFAGPLHFYFMNDNAVTGVSVLLKVVAVQVVEQWATRPVQRMRVDSREEMYLKL